jgi:predicted nuclease of predicted toxin-antitoxin system
MLDLQGSGDQEVFDYAAANAFVIASKDEDFHQLAFLHGPPPKVVWIRLGNCTTNDVERELRDGADRVSALED